MNPLLILREEIVCLVILLFLLVNALAYQTGRDSGSFLRLALCAVGHVACEILVVLAMTPPGRVGAGANRLFHAFFYLFAVLFAYEFFCCTVRLGFASRAAVRRALEEDPAQVALEMQLDVERLQPAGPAGR